MGEARRRGTREQRVREAKKRRELGEEKIYPNQRKHIKAYELNALERASLPFLILGPQPWSQDHERF